MRYRIISNENTTGEEWVNQTVAGFCNRQNAIEVCKRLPIPCYAIDTLTGETLYKR